MFGVPDVHSECVCEMLSVFAESLALCDSFYVVVVALSTCRFSDQSRERDLKRTGCVSSAAIVPLIPAIFVGL